MVFSSTIFLFYFLPVFLLVYFLVDRKYKNGIALLASLLFYGFGSPRFLLILLLSILIDFFIVRQINKNENEKRKKTFLLLSIILNIGLLAYFKYANFFVDNFNTLLSAFGLNPMRWTKVVLPIGISFFTFQKMSYSIDVYRKTSAPLQSIADYALFIMLFPQLIAGPIVRYNEVADQLLDRRANENIDNKLLGLYRFIIGLSKKMLIANILAEYVDHVFALPATEIGMATAWLGMLAYTFQIYFDFSGYSDMAIGIGRMIGFKFPENFNSPYISESVSEFWKRWHITLGRWMMDYLYIPLGGNRKGSRRTYLNLWIVFFLSGLWHGAAWNFVAWGAFHGLFIVMDKMFWIKASKRIGKLPRVLITFLIVMVGWVLFRADSIGYAFQYIGTLFGFHGQSAAANLSPQLVFTLIVAVFFSFFGMTRLGDRCIDFFFNREKYRNPQYLWVGILMVVLLVLSASFILKGSFNPFIYFRF